MVSETTGVDGPTPDDWPGAEDCYAHDNLIWMEPEDVAQATLRLATDIYHSPSREAALTALFYLLKLRDKSGCYWTLGINTLAWYRQTGKRWSRAEQPHERLEGPVWIANRVPDKSTGDEMDDLPAEETLEVGSGDATAMMRDRIDSICEDYRNGLLTSRQTHDLLRQNYLIDKQGIIWTIGARSRVWYALIDEKWQKQLSPLSAGDLPDEAEMDALAPRIWLGIADLIVEDKALPETVTPTWHPLRTQPEVFIPNCRSCGARRKPGLERCYRCGKDPLARPEPASPPGSPAIEGRTCPICGHAVADDARFCTECGHRLELEETTSEPTISAKHCPKCGAEVPPDARFCTQCGAPLGDEPQK
ncbi:zinc ribbon domain-containing protein [Breoghania sp.]|uniref:zinc ribbon domain-containing protein n=1 Tax=Breoghania sp. TaxID=2065378 RepID=UPI002AA790AE|nr:zinc ribbon domain-containing protein [Breoghania sp.]